MKEDLLHFIWKYQLFESTNIQTSNHQQLIILKTGTQNSDAGPDFFNAKIKIGSTTWVGNIEIHIKSSDWYRHNHQKDKAYDNVILHMVFENDQPVTNTEGFEIPCLELKGIIDKDLINSYEGLLKSKSWIPCKSSIQTVDAFTTKSWISRLTIERLEEKSSLMKESLDSTKHDWNTLFYEQIAKGFGLKVNSLPMELLAKSLPINLLAKHKSNALQIEALLFGQSGLLPEKSDDKYIHDLKKEFAFLGKKYQLKPLNSSVWKFLRLRPAAFPTIRLAQFAQLIYKSSNLFSHVLEASSDIKQLQKLLTCDVSSFWETHYTFEKISTKKKKSIGESTIDIIIINIIAPLLFLYGSEKGEEKFKDQAISLLEKLKPEKNSIISKWADLGVKSKDAVTTQGLLQLKNQYCDQKKCLQCGIGLRILK